MTIGERIKSKREELGLTQDDLAKRVGYKSRSSINKIELSRNLPLTKVSLIAKALGCPEAELMGWNELTDLQKDIMLSTEQAFENQRLRRLLAYYDLLSSDNQTKVLTFMEKLYDVQKIEDGE